MVPPWQGCRLPTSSVVVAVMLGTDTASVTGTELSEEEEGRPPLGGGSGPLQAGSGGAWICWGLGDSSGRSSPDGAAQGLICRIEKHMAQILSSPSGRNVDKIAEMDLRWEMGSLFNTAKRGDKVVAAVF